VHLITTEKGDSNFITRPQEQYWEFIGVINRLPYLDEESDDPLFGVLPVTIRTQKLACGILLDLTAVNRLNLTSNIWFYAVSTPDWTWFPVISVTWFTIDSLSGIFTATLHTSRMSLYPVFSKDPLLRSYLDGCVWIQQLSFFYKSEITGHILRAQSILEYNGLVVHTYRS